MDVSTVFLLLCVFGLSCSLTTVLRANRLGPLTFLYFLSGWLTGELVAPILVLQATVTVAFGLAGAFETGPGLVGLALTFLSWGILVHAHLQAVSTSGPAVAAAAADLDLDAATDDIGSWHRAARPFGNRTPGVRVERDVVYGEALAGDKGRRNRLDVIRPHAEGEGRPVLLQVHGGAWVTGQKEQQGQPLMHHLAERGWICVALNYRLGPKATFPDPIVDVKRAIHWIRENADALGADPDFICISGGSAGGHLSSLAALSENDPRFQPGFEHADTSLSACVPFYGVYDLLDRAGLRGRRAMGPFLTRMLMKRSPEEDPELWESASPVARIHEDAPPFLVLHGTHDSLVFVEEARLFVAALRQKSRRPVVYAEFPGGQHAFDIFHSVRSAHAVRLVAAFLERMHTEHRESNNH